jgi:hypothetical protein
MTICFVAGVLSNSSYMPANGRKTSFSATRYIVGTFRPQLKVSFPGIIPFVFVSSSIAWQIAKRSQDLPGQFDATFTDGGEVRTFQIQREKADVSLFLLQNAHQNTAAPFASDQRAVALPSFLDKATLPVTGDCAMIEVEYAQFNPVKSQFFKSVA